MKASSAKAKGKLLEDWIVSRFRLTGLDNRAYRQKGSGSGLNKGDVWNDLGLCIEAKNQKKFLSKWVDQVNRETMTFEKPVIVWHPPQRPLEDSWTMIPWYYFEELLLKSKQPVTTNPDSTTAYKIRRLVQSAKDLLKELE